MAKILFSALGKFNKCKFKVFEEKGVRYLEKIFPMERYDSWENEKEAYRLLSSKSYPYVPRLFDFGNNGVEFYLLMEYIQPAPSKDLSQNVVMTSWQRKGLIEELGQALSILHSLDFEKHGLYHRLTKNALCYNPVDYWYSQVDGLRKIEKGKVIQTYSKIEELISGYGSDVAQHLSQPCLIHRDITLRNLVYSNGDGIRLFDWEVSMIGHPDSDLARLIWLGLKDRSDLVLRLFSGYQILPERRTEKNIRYFRIIFCIEMLKYLLKLNLLDNSSVRLRNLMYKELNSLT